MSSPQLELVLERIAAAGADLRESGADRWRGDCVGCGGSDRMTVQLDLNNAVSVGCFSAACSEQDRLQVLNLTPEDLRPQRERAAGRVTFATDVHAKPVHYLIPGRVPLGAVSLLAGDPKLGKSTLACLFAAGVSLGKLGVDPATVLIVSAEDSFTRILKPRVAVAGGALGRVAKFEIVDADGARYPDLPDNVPELSAAVAEHQVRLVVVDPLNAFLGGSVDSWKDHGVRRALAPLARMAEEHDCAVLVVVHLNKQRGGDPLYRIGGSIGQVGAARSVLSFGRDPGDPDEDRGARRLLGHLASNWGALAPTQLFELETVAIELDDELIETSRLTYVRDTEQSAGDAFGVRGREDRGEDCEEAILEQLDDGERHPSREVKTVVMAELSVSASTVERAAKRLADRGELVVHERSSSGQGGARRGTEWQLQGHVALRGHVNPIAVRDVTSNSPRQSQKSEVTSRDRNGDATSTPRDATSAQPLGQTDQEWLDGLLEEGPLDELFRKGS